MAGEESWAHSRNDDGERHSLARHLRGTADLAEGFGNAFGAGGLTRYLGLVHDVGKAECAWQDGLLHGLGLLLRSDLDVESFDGRTKRPPTDPANCLLSLLYGLLRSSVHGALEGVGLDPYVGYLHGLRPGKPSLALDMMEEFRPVLADRLALTLLNRRQLRNEHFHRLPGGAVQLSDDARRLVLTEWQQRKRQEWRHELLDRNIPAQLLPVIQARIFARHLRGELPTYVPWALK